MLFIGYFKDIFMVKEWGWLTMNRWGLRHMHGLSYHGEMCFLSSTVCVFLAEGWSLLLSAVLSATVSVPPPPSSFVAFWWLAMDEEDSQDELINRNASHGKGKRLGSAIMTDEGEKIWRIWWWGALFIIFHDPGLNCWSGNFPVMLGFPSIAV